MKILRTLRTTTLAVLSASAVASLLAACGIPRDVPREAAGNPGLERFSDLQSRLDKLNSGKRFGAGAAADSVAVAAGKYDWAKAQCWVRNAYSERHENEAAGFAAAALDEADKIVNGLESGSNAYKDTALINHTERVRPNLWQRAEKIKQSTGFACAASTVACMEVQLSRSGHELTETGWRHANTYVAIAEDMAAKAEKEAATCALPAPPPPAATPLAPPPPGRTVEKVTLNASALFRFDKRTQADLLPQGKTEMDQLAERIKQVYANVESISLTGYTDRLGSTGYNAKLSQDRADTVKAYLQSKGVNAPMTTAGRGPAEPVVQCAGSKTTPKLTECLQPNRRVEIVITGTKRSAG
jgi:OmpA-OmpF porin, OOP family